MTAPALASLALRFECNVPPLRVEPLQGARFRVTIFPAFLLPRSGDPYADAATLMARSMNRRRHGSAIAPSNGSGCTDAGRISCYYLNRNLYAADLGQRKFSSTSRWNPAIGGASSLASVDPGSAADTSLINTVSYHLSD